MFDRQNRYVISDYQSKPPFSSFLPGIAGEFGIPAWCYYNNRGQAVCSFGARDKDHAIMEFSPAHVGYRDVGRTGFRTFCKINGQYCELFTETADMHIGMSELELRCEQEGLAAEVLYFGVPGEPFAGLARSLTLRNLTDRPMMLELLDGMAQIVPYGLNQDFLKNMTQLAKAWMQAEDQEKGLAYFRVRASLEDGAIVREVRGGNFCLGWEGSGTLLRPIVQSSLVFGQDTSLSVARSFRSTPLEMLTDKKQVSSNQFPCCFLPLSRVLQPGESLTVHSIYGQAENKNTVARLADATVSDGWFARKRADARDLADRITAPIACKTADPVFDAYARQTYLDNALRGGAPLFFRSEGKTVPFHIYSRKHGDPEREYNYFSLGQEYYAQGNGNYRDVNQNRRCDVLFAPEMEEENIRTFFDLIQTDGYNPLVLTPCTYTLPEAERPGILRECAELEPLLSGEFTPGAIAMAARNAQHPDPAGLTARVICRSTSEPNADFGEGYWCDHWTYNLDQIEAFLTVYPEKKDTLLFTEGISRWYEAKVPVNPRHRRYTMTENGLRQYYALDESAPGSDRKWMQTADGVQARSSIMEKLLLLCAIKTATLDAAGMGVEMEGGRPGWYDALNGLPGLFGSSMAETCELARLLDFTAEALEEKGGGLNLYSEIAGLLEAVTEILQSEQDPYRRWDALNDCKERYRLETRSGYQGSRRILSCAEIARMLRIMEAAALQGIEQAKAMNGGLIPTYFTFEASEIRSNIPRCLTPRALPLFLEGPVRYLKLNKPREEKAALADALRESGLYDKNLRMYKVNESLAGVSYEAGRALAFTPGWLENESVWLHMAYKYLLELLKSGLYEEFSRAFRDGAVPFLSPEIYGRSPLENVSFIASSANPDPQIHGRGFVARLSGSTAEFIHMWQILFFGQQPFRLENGQLSLVFAPFIPEYLMAQQLTCTFLGHTAVTYHCGSLPQLQPGITRPVRYDLTWRDSRRETWMGSSLPETVALAVREGSITDIQVFMR